MPAEGCLTGRGQGDMVARKLSWFDPYDSSPTGYLIMWVEFIVGPCFALREMSDVVLLKSLEGRYIFGRVY